MVLCSWEQETSVGHAVSISPERQLAHLTRLAHSGWTAGAQQGFVRHCCQLVRPQRGVPYAARDGEGTAIGRR